MSSKYDTIETAADLVTEVAAHGLSTIQEDICRAQDIFGNSAIEELARLANDIGRNNEKGEPDPKGSWSGSRRPTQGTFYMIAFSIWNWEDATRFWNQHTNPQTEQAKKTTEELREAKKDAKEWEEIQQTTSRSLTAVTQERNELAEDLERTRAELAKAQKEVTELKARLYDYMTAKIQATA